MKKILLVFLFALPNLLSAQFSGKITYKAVDRNDQPFEVWFSADKIRFKSVDLKSNKMSSMGMDASEFIYEPKLKRITMFLKKEKTALEVDIVALKQMMDGLAALSAGGSTVEKKEVPQALVKKTTISRKMLGYDAYKVEVRQKEGTETLDLWCSDKLKYDWNGVLDLLTLGGYTNDAKTVSWLSQNYLPLRMDFKDGDKLSSYEATSVALGTNPSDFAIPAGYSKLTFQEFMQAMMLKSMMGN